MEIANGEGCEEVRRLEWMVGKRKEEMVGKRDKGKQ